MNKYEVWTEGYAASGERGTAVCHSVVGADYEHGYPGVKVKIEAESFIDACIKVLGKALDRNPDGTLRLSSDGRPMVWACCCYDNEIDARKTFG